MGTHDETAEAVTQWGRDVERRHAWLLHTQNLAVGPVERYYTGAEGDQYKSAIDGVPVVAPVVVLGTGHALLAREPAMFVEIGPDEASIYINTIDSMRKAIVDACNEAARILHANQQRPELPMALVVAALRAQLHALEATATTEPAPALVTSTEGA
jgi:hypothetical protein